MELLTGVKRVYDRVYGLFSFTIGCVGLFVS